MAAKLSPVLNSQIFDANGTPLIGGTIETYLAGSSTPFNTFTSSDGLTPQTNPIVLNALGQSANLIWLQSGSFYKFIVKDSLGNVQNTLDNIQGVNELVVNLDQWIASSITPTYINATTFTLSGDQTSIYQIGRRLRLSVTAGTLYGTVQSAIYGALTTIIVKLDSGTIDAGLSSLSYGILTPDNSSIPSIFEDYRQTIIATATTTPLWDAVGKIQDWTGTPTITAFPTAPQAGSQRIVYPAAGTVITDNANIDVQGNASYTVVAGDELTITAINTTTFYVTIQRKDGQSVIPSRRIAQVQTFQTGAVATGTTLIPNDNTIPQNTEGDQYMSLAITPQNASSLLEIEITWLGSSSISNELCVALFQDSNVNALAATDVFTSVTNARVCVSFTHYMNAATTSITTFKVRAGMNAANTTTFNGASGSQLLGGVMASRITIKEYLP